jgi:metal-responsive CopG/Arc/MetJ family transcriptional regulator
MKRGSVKTRKSDLVALWIPKPLAAALDRGVKIEDSDRSKFIRNAVREKLQRAGIQFQEAA